MSLTQRSSRSLFKGDREYPDLLASIDDAPEALYVEGKLKSLPGLAIVGSRQPTPYGRRMARLLAREAALAGFAVVSGLARGIDTEAHRAAIDAGGTTWAVLGSGLDRLYPPENESLAREIVDLGGCVLTEFSLGTPPVPGNFPRRNRIVAGLAWGTVLVEGRARSGSLITARLAAEQGREVFAVPGPADSPLSEAPHRMISQGAKLVSCFADILEELPVGVREGVVGLAPTSGLYKEAREDSLAKGHRDVLEWLGSDSLSPDEISRGTGLTLPETVRFIFELEMQDLLEALPGQKYAKKRKEA